MRAVTVVGASAVGAMVVVERDGEKLQAKVSAMPARTDVTFEVREQLIVELMSK